MQIETEVTITLTLNGEEAMLVASALEALRQRGVHPFTAVTLTTAEDALADSMREDLADAVPVGAGRDE